MDPKKIQAKARAAEKKGDAALKKNKFKTALKYYRETQALLPEEASVYEKLIKAHQGLKNDWTDEDFSESMAWTMKKQELENPALKRVHAKLTSEWAEVSKLVKELIQAKDGAAEEKAIEQIRPYGEIALFALIETVLAFKKAHEKPKAP